MYALSIAFMPSGELFSMEMNLIPKQPTLDNFAQAFTKTPLFRFILNSFLVAGCITLGQIISCSLAAFALSFLDFKGKNVIFMLIMATMMVPGEATIISNYLTVSGWGWLNSYKVLIIPYITSAMGIFLFRQFYLTFPKSLYEAAKIDGASGWKSLWHITIPNVMPSITICTFLSLTNGFKLYDQNLALTGGEPYVQLTDGNVIKTTEMLALNIVSSNTSNTKGPGQAKAVVFFILVGIIGIAQLIATRKKEVQQ